MSFNTEGYGDWRRARSLGIGSMDARQTIIVLVCVLLPVFIGSLISITTGLIVAAPCVVMLLLTAIRRGGVVVLDAMTARVRWQLAAWRGHTIYRAQILTHLPRAWDLPGVLAPVRLLEVEEPGRTPVGVAWNQRTGKMTATLLLSPAGALLADAGTIGHQVASWGQLLANLADDQTITHAAVTIELVPESGIALADHVRSRIDPAAPQVAQQTLEDLVTAAPRGSSQVRARLSLTVNPLIGNRKARSVIDSAAEVVRTLGGLSAGAAGAEVLRRATATDLIRITRCAFDPAAEQSAATQFGQLEWADSGPVAADDGYGSYQHDGAWSISWALLAAPRQRVAHDVLFPLLKPGRFPRRVTIFYRVMSRDEAGAVLEREVNVAAAREYARKKSKRDPTAREYDDAQRAGRAARQEARGAGLVQFVMTVTTTVTDRAQLEDARREVERAAGDAKLKLRVAYGGQAAAFAAGLPCGIFPPDA